MDALWKLEDKLKISTQKAVVLLICTSILVILVCLTIIFVVLKKKAAQRNKIACHDEFDEETESMIVYERSHSKCGLMEVRKALLGSACWSLAHKWNDESVVLGKQRMNVVSSCLKCLGCVGRSKMPVWQRPILMGERCELPRFSGLILYDERGRPITHHYDHHHHQYYQQVSNTIYNLLQFVSSCLLS
ncbi:uncharacterized protein LOC110694568 [Chenopodium quinoa]|uniref:uncharacterized protein LOC110694568 n=1 Tax=Chenopodium quinoa TaxID=63459 RepID=UPI000B78A3C7|nr:uncharacterized protein LOC110694568 [Chenopodium quinoa]